MGRLVGLVLLWCGFLSGAFVSVRQSDTIDWMHYGIAVAITLVGVWITRLTARRALTQDGRIERDIVTLRSSLEEVDRRVRALHEARDRVDVSSVHNRIDTEFMPVIAEFVAARTSMITAFDLETYGKVMTDFALGERLLNRAWCASADGYIDETWSSLARASEAIARAKDTLPGC